ncbi:MAG: DUF4331 domain-containing protein [Acidobacteria bacterium]|nr:DUF4331 domain-containing protein [Acidobacteriota bacterium]
MIKNRASAAVVLAAAFLFALSGAPDGRGADHLDAPDLSPPGGNLMTDIADLFAFPDDERMNQVTIGATYNPAAGVFGPTGFDPTAEYVFNVDMDGDAEADTIYTFEFMDVRPNGRQDYVMRQDGAIVATGNTDRVMGLDDGSGRVFAGLRDDPFFFDLDAFLGSGGRAFCDGSENDFFAGLNVNAIMFQMPADAFDGAPIGVWATTNGGGGTSTSTQTDRMGFPAINTVFIPSKRKNAYNDAVPGDDVKRFSRFLRKGFKGGGNTAKTARALTGVLLPDILPFDPSGAPGFLNGRLPADDVIDAELGLLTAGALTGDCVDANDVPFLDDFPYLADAH